MEETQQITTTTNMNTQSAPKSLESIPGNVPAVMPRVVIVGAGFGGLQAARALASVSIVHTGLIGITWVAEGDFTRDRRNDTPHWGDASVPTHRPLRPPRDWA